MYLICSAVVVSKDSVLFVEFAKGLEVDASGTMIEKDDHPGYPMMILGVHNMVAVFGGGGGIFSWIYSAQIAALMLRLFAIVALYFVGKKLVGGKFGFWAVLILICLPKPAGYGSDALSDWPHLFFLAVGFLLLIMAAKEGKWALFGVVGLAAGVGYLVRIECAQLVIYAALWLGFQFFWKKRNLSRSKAVLSLVLLAVGFLITAGPYMKLQGVFSFAKQVDVVGVNTQVAGAGLCEQQVVSSRASIVPADIGAGFAKLVENIGETLMWVFVPAMLIGFCKFFRKGKWYEPEKFFVIAIIVFNAIVMVWLYCSRGYMSIRHTLPLVAIIVFYIPAGLEALAGWLDEKWFKKGNTRLGFTVLIAIGIAMCLPKLLRPLHYDKGTLREAASWLAENSEESDVIGSVDPRIGFYAERNSVHYDGIIVPQEVKYLVRIFKKAEDVPADDVGGYRKVFSFEGDVKKRLVVIYENPL